MSEIRIYVACLAAYNNGKLHGEWIDATQDADAIQEDVNRMLKNSPEPDAEEWAIHDYEGFCGIKLGEWESFEKVSELANAIEQHGEAFAIYADDVGADAATVKGFRDAFAGEYDSEEDYAAEFLEQTGGLASLDESLRGYFDYAAYARDLFNGDIWSQRKNGKVYVFHRI